MLILYIDARINPWVSITSTTSVQSCIAVTFASLVDEVPPLEVVDEGLVVAAPAVVGGFVVAGGGTVVASTPPPMR